MAQLKDYAIVNLPVDPEKEEIRKDNYWSGVTFEFPDTFDIDLTGAFIKSDFISQQTGNKIHEMSTNNGLFEILSAKSFKMKGQSFTDVPAGLSDYDVLIICANGTLANIPIRPLRGILTVNNTPTKR